ncbi:MAG: hypothetical protein FWB85_02155 [Chitinispirillia bacterium]|nr:hypothetical protein [Chitinispirillia bacterium]MCL2241209.1 hypothetical protein [Chitinispirillia bacterium]
MVNVLIIVAVLVFLILVALMFGLGRRVDRGDDEADERQSIIHMSGVYSIVHKSPREDLLALRPRETEIRSYLNGVSADTQGVPLSHEDKSALLRHWKVWMETGLREIDKGDKDGLIFYYYDFTKPCPVCAGFIDKGNYVTREEIFRNPCLIPPFHLGCTCTLTAHQGSEKTVRETVLVGMLPFLKGGDEPSLPKWTNIVSLHGSAEAKG